MNKIIEPSLQMLKLGRIMPSCILASSSVNRLKLLKDSNIDVKVYKPVVEEEKTAESTSLLVTINAEKKLKEYLSSPSFDPDWVAVSADTLVEVDGNILGKPENEIDAFSMLLLLSGKEQVVYSGCALYNPCTSLVSVFTDEARVEFRALREKEIEDYIALGEWKGAAGAYRMQKSGYRLVKSISGDWATVVGLPIDKIIQILSTD